MISPKAFLLVFLMMSAVNLQASNTQSKAELIAFTKNHIQCQKGLMSVKKAVVKEVVVKENVVKPKIVKEKAVKEKVAKHKAVKTKVVKEQSL